MNLSSPARSMPWTGNRVADTILREMEAHRKRLGNQLLELRKARGWSQEDAAHEVGVGVKTWRLWERGKTLPYDSNIRKLAEAFNVDPDHFGQIRPAPLGMGDDLSASPVGDAITARLDDIQGALESARLEREQHTAQIERLLSDQDDRLKRQDAVLERIERAVEAERQIRDEAQAATQALLAAVDVANRVLLGGTPPLAEAPEQQST